MNQTLTISDALYARLAMQAQLRGLSVEQLIEEWERQDAELQRRREGVRRINETYEQMAAKYGVMPDSTELLREDRAR